MTVLDEIKAPVADDLVRYREAFREALRSDNPLIEQAVTHLIQATGKQIRPMLVFLAARMFGEVNERVVYVALALEMLHTASLVHDDVVDESDRRRGIASVNALMTNQIAVLVGDYILSKSLEYSAMTGDVRVVRNIAQLGQALADGELLQLNNLDSEEFSDVTYYDVISRKTASLFASCARLGVLTSGGTEEQAERLAMFGKLIGMCFQVRDDVFDYGTADIGKPVGNDMKEGKLTLPVLYALNKSGDEAMRQVALKVRRQEASAEEIQQLIDFTIGEGGIDYAAWRMKDMMGMADGLIDDSCNPAIVKSLHTLAAFVSERNF